MRRKNRRPRPSRRFSESTVAMSGTAHPGDNPETARVLNILGFTLTMQGNLQEANQFLKDGLAMRRRLFDDRQPDVASSLIAIAILQNAQGKYPEALEEAQNAKGIYSAALSPDHWRTALAECAEGAALTGLGRYPEAEALLAHSYGILTKDGRPPLVFRVLAKRYLETLHRRERRASASLTAATKTQIASAK